jgi:hypothetical protein
MARKQIYYPANQISDVNIAGPGEFIDAETLEPYEGPYVEANGTYLTGDTSSPESRLLKLVEGTVGEKFRNENGTEYFKLTGKEYFNHNEPLNTIAEPTPEDYEDGQFQRYFAQKKNELNRIYEIDRDQYGAFNNRNKEGVDSVLYNRIEIQWMLKGDNAIQLNRENIDLAEARFPGIKKYLSNPAELVASGIKEKSRTYADGTSISDNLPPAYVNTPPVAGQRCMNCKFRHNNYCSYWVAQVRNEYWCMSWKAREGHEAPSFTENFARD